MITGKGKDEVLEHFWLCGPCYEEYNFAFPPGGEVIRLLKPENRAIQKEFHFGEIVIAAER